MRHLNSGICLQCGNTIIGGNFCKSSGHHILYKNQLLRDLKAGTISSEGKEQLIYFKWMPQDYVEVQPVRRTRTRAKKEVGFDIDFRKFGVELECLCPINSESDIISDVRSLGYSMQHTRYTHTDCPQWKSLYDASVRPDDSNSESKEFVSPAFETVEGVNQVADVCKVISDRGGYVNQTAGTHIHLDASDLTPQDFAKIVYLYGKIESKVDQFFPNNRKANHNKYCQSVKRFVKYADKSGLDYFDTMYKVNRVLGTRYLKVNCEAYNRHQTVEFRQLAGTLSGDMINNWRLFVTRIVDYVKSGKDVKEVNGRNMFKLLGLRQNEIDFWNETISSMTA